MEEELTAEEFVRDKVKALKTIDSLRDANIQKIKALGTYGKGIDAGLLANLKIDTFTDTFLDEDAKLVYRLNVEKKLKDILEETLAELRSQQIIQGVAPQTGRLIVPK